MKLPKSVEFIIETLNRKGYEAYIVGGCVRDSLLGKSPEDWDITTSAKPAEVKKCFNKTIDTGIRHGTVTVLMNKMPFEVTTYRIDGKYEDYRRPVTVSFDACLEEDLKRRDFTINAMAYHPRTGLADYFGGREDLRKKIIRGVGDPLKRFDEDALRMLRAVRFAAQLNFEIEKQTKNAIAQKSFLITKISTERIRDELDKILYSENKGKFSLLKETGLFQYLFPELTESYKENEKRILSDLNKIKEPFFGFAVLFFFTEREKSEFIMKHLKFDNKTIEKVRILLRYSPKKLDADKFQIKQWLCGLGKENFESVVQFKEIIDQKSYKDIFNIYVNILKNKECVFLKELNINGYDLMQSGFSKGKEVGAALEYLQKMVWLNPEKNEKEILLNEIAKKFIK